LLFCCPLEQYARPQESGNENACGRSWRARTFGGAFPLRRNIAQNKKQTRGKRLYFCYAEISTDKYVPVVFVFSFVPPSLLAHNRAGSPFPGPACFVPWGLFAWDFPRFLRPRKPATRAPKHMGCFDASDDLRAWFPWTKEKKQTDVRPGAPTNAGAPGLFCVLGQIAANVCKKKCTR
jgi:hypothetical protein